MSTPIQEKTQTKAYLIRGGRPLSGEVAVSGAKNAATKQKYNVVAPENRITKTSWFIRKHDEIKADVWKRAGVKSPANCGACHTTAAEGIFSEKNISIPAK